MRPSPSSSWVSSPCSRRTSSGSSTVSAGASGSTRRPRGSRAGASRSWAAVPSDARGPGHAARSTGGALGEEAFGAMNAWAGFVNVGRGSTVDEAALVRALAEGRIAGAALDVFEEEPLPASSPLWSMANVVVSPHMSGDFAGWRETVVELFVENLERYLTGRPLRGVVDKRRGYVPS